MRMRGASLIAGLALCVAASPGSAHHSLAPYVRTTVGVVIGKVKEFTWTNPHTRLIVLVPGEGGTMVEWNFEGVSTSRLATAGFKKASIFPGDTISVVYNPRRDKSPGGMFVAVGLPNGTTLRLDRYQEFHNGAQRIE
jgi:hypothetical protein